MAKKTTATAAPAGEPAAPKKPARRTRWLDPKTKTPLIDDYARNMQSFLEAMADGVIQKEEREKQEKKLAGLMETVEPKLDDELHEQVTQLLCEITVYDVMRLLVELQQGRPTSKFRG